jgi:ATP phosphoribosyltransferase regulatory subunit
MTFSLPLFQRHLALAGYEMRDVPYIERADLFSTKGGDRVIEHLLTFEYGNAEYALRPEFTASAAREFASAGQPVVRWQFTGPVFEDRAGAGHHTFERHSAGIELLGMSGPLGDSEVIGLAASGLIAQGINDFQIVIGHAGLTRALIERYTAEPQLVQFLLSQRGALSDPAQGRGVVEDALHRFLNVRKNGGHTAEIGEEAGLSDLLASVTLRTSTLGGRTRDDIARRLLRKQRRTDEVEQIARAVDALQAWVTLNGATSVVLPQIYQFAEDEPAFAKITAELRTTLDLLESFGVASDSIILQPDLNRIWDYYSGIVFELRTPDGQSLGGGGRYDGLLRLLGNPVDAPAVGFQVNVDAIWKRFGTEPNIISTVALIASRAHAKLVFDWANGLRAIGVACEVFEDESDLDRPSVRIDPEGAHFGGLRFFEGQAAELAAFLKEQNVL